MGNPTTFKNRVAWALVYLQAARMIRKVERGTYQSEARAKSLLAQEPPVITLETLRQYPEMLRHLSENALRASETRRKNAGAVRRKVVT